MTAGTMTSPAKIRIDQLLVERGLAESREKAQALIIAGEVVVNGQKALKPGHSVAADSRVEVLERMPYVSRGGYKLAGALDHWTLDVTGWLCLDVGASTGGFTDCLLQRGAAKVWAIDVGHGQIDWKLRNDARVVVQEGVNARYLATADFPEKFDLAVCDASFISLTLLIPALAPLPEQVSQVTEVGSRICAVLPEYASSSVISMLKRRSAPRSRPEVRCRAPPMPKMPSKMSAKAEPKS